MGKQEVLDLLAKHRHEIAERFGVKDLGIFGSVASGCASDQSDIDVLVDFGKNATFDHFMDLKFYLEDLLDATVDLVTQNALRENMRTGIMQRLIHVA